MTPPSFCSLTDAMPQELPPGPVTPMRPDVLRVRGREHPDPYHWLRDDRWQEVMRDPSRLRTDVREHLERENAHTSAALAVTEGLQAQLLAELRGRIQEDDASVPEKDGNWLYYLRYQAGGEHPLYCRRPLALPPTDAGAQAPAAVEQAGPEQVLHDADLAARQYQYYRPGQVEHSPNHALLAYGADCNGSELFEIRFKSLADDSPLPDVIESTTGHVVFSADSGAVFYTRVDEQHRPCQVWKHRLGTSVAEDRLVYEESDPGFFVDVSTTEDQRWVVISTHDHSHGEVRLIPRAMPDEAPVLLTARRPGVEYSVSSYRDGLLVLTNDGAEDFKLALAPCTPTDPASWKELAPHRPGCLIVAVLTFAHHVVWLEREQGLPRIVVQDIESGERHSIAFDEATYSLGLVPGLEYDTPWLRFTYSSLTTPSQTFDYHLRTRTRVLRKTRAVPSGHSPERYRTARLLAPSHDGALVPVSVLWHEATPLDGSAPVLLYGYGSYGLTIPAAFSASVLSLVNRGFVYAIAHVRGGKDLGYAWYREGKLAHKINTFKDFIAAAGHLCDKGFGTRGDISIQGGSAGGMLVGAALNMAPGLFKAAVAEVPFVDVLCTMCDPSLPLTPPEWPEWGNPLESDEAYEWIASYSPCDNIREQDYPHVLATAGLTDPRVTYWEPAKWIARLRAKRTNRGLTLLKTHMDAGHGGAAGRFEKLSEVALIQAFLLLCHQRLNAPLLPPT